MSDLFRLDGKSALVTGAGRGIRLAAAEALARHGAEVTLVARTVEEIEAEAARLRGEDHEASPLRLDVPDIETFGAAIAGAGPSTSWSTMLEPVFRQPSST